MSDAPIQPENRPPPFPDAAPRTRPAVDPYAEAFGQASDPKKAKSRLMVPGIFIVLVGLLNLVPGFGCMGIGFAMSSFADDDLEKILRQQNPQQWEQVKQQGYDVHWYKAFYLYSGVGIGIVSLLLTLATLIGGGCMIAGRSMFLCVVGALAAIVSPGGCGLLGLAIGVWALMVLLSEDVRAAFRAA
jgi:hypothetical protein